MTLSLHRPHNAPSVSHDGHTRCTHTTPLHLPERMRVAREHTLHISCTIPSCTYAVIGSGRASLFRFPFLSEM